MLLPMPMPMVNVLANYLHVTAYGSYLIFFINYLNRNWVLNFICRAYLGENACIDDRGEIQFVDCGEVTDSFCSY